MRLDKYLCEMNIGSRSEVKDFIRKGRVLVDGVVCKKPELHVDECKQVITCNGVPVVYQKEFYYMLHKPAGVITATTDMKEKTVMDLIPNELRRDDLICVGRLDKDTTGILLITNNGDLSHKLLSNKYHVAKTYLATLQAPLNKADCCRLEEGLDIGEEKPTLPAVCKIVDSALEPQALLTITEGRYHQVKRMFEAVGNKVIRLHRICFGPLNLDDGLSAGSLRALTQDEIECLKKCVIKNDRI